MGTQVMIDLIGSIVVFGWLLLMTLRVNTANQENMQTLSGDLLVQENLVEVTQLLEYDFRKIGFCREPNNLTDPTKAILLADTSRLKFLTDVDFGSGPDGTIGQRLLLPRSHKRIGGDPESAGPVSLPRHKRATGAGCKSRCHLFLVEVLRQKRCWNFDAGGDRRTSEDPDGSDHPKYRERICCIDRRDDQQAILVRLLAAGAAFIP